MLREEKKAGITLYRDLWLLLESFDSLPNEMKEFIWTQTDPDILEKILEAAVESNSLEQFREEVSHL